MRFMHWSYFDLCICPEFHKDVLIDMVQEELKAAEHRRALEEARAGHRRR